MKNQNKKAKRAQKVKARKLAAQKQPIYVQAMDKAMKGDHSMINKFTNSITASPIMEKQTIISRLRQEVKICKQENQAKVWAFYNFKAGDMQWFDTLQELAMVENLYSQQGYTEKSVRVKQHIAQTIGASQFQVNVYKNPDAPYKTPGASDLSMDPVSMLGGEYMNAYNEFIILEVTI